MNHPGQRTVAWFHCYAGIAGDMALGSLLDAGAELDEVLGLLGRLPFHGWGLSAEPVLRAGVAATRAVVEASDDVVVRTHAHIVGLVEEARLPARVAKRSLAVFGALAEVEGRLHRRPPSQVHFHEVGSHDTIIDVVGTAAALEVLGVDEVTSSSVATGTGTVRSSHGFLPNPSPAVVRLLEGVPTWGRDIGVELTTPTGAAILAALASGFGPLPPMRIGATGFGAGSHELDDLPNCTQVVVGESVAEAGPGQPVVLLEANLDDATGETLAYAVQRLLDAGALDAWITPVIMKKGRPGSTVSALVDPALVESLRQVLRAETGSLGVRATTEQRWPAARSMEQVEVEGVVVAVKVSPGRVKVEQADAARAAARTGLPLREVVLRAEAAWRRRVETAAEERSTGRRRRHLTGAVRAARRADVGLTRGVRGIEAADDRYGGCRADTRVRRTGRSACRSRRLDRRAVAGLAGGDRSGRGRPRGRSPSGRLAGAPRGRRARRRHAGTARRHLRTEGQRGGHRPGGGGRSPRRGPPRPAARSRAPRAFRGGGPAPAGTRSLIRYRAVAASTTRPAATRDSSPFLWATSWRLAGR